MLTLAIFALFTVAGIVAVLVIADTLLKAREAYVRLMRDGEVMRAGFALQAAAIEMQLRPAARSVTARRRSVAFQPRTLQICAAA
jgi:hypothetical protein